MEQRLQQRQLDIVIPAHRPGKDFAEVLRRIALQEDADIASLTLVVTRESAQEALSFEETFVRPFRESAAGAAVPVRTMFLSPEEFDHGGARNMGAEAGEAPVIVFMTQDAVPASPHTLARLAAALFDGEEEEDAGPGPDGEFRVFDEEPEEAPEAAGDREFVPLTAAAYARQLPRRGADLLERVSRRFNYPKESRTKTAEDLSALGIKTYFCSNVCAAYRRGVWEDLGRFEEPVGFNEDMLFAARAIGAGYRVRYAADARVYHSHADSLKKLFRRNFDMGISQAEHPEVFADVPAEGEGMRLVKESARACLKAGKPQLLILLFLRSAARYAGYLLGKKWRLLPQGWAEKISLCPGYWKKVKAAAAPARRSPDAPRPLVSVCIPTYNSAQTVERTIRSVLEQDYEPLEVIVSDDVSSDDTEAVVRAIGDPRVRFIPHEVNAGMANNWNQSIFAAGGEFVKLLCADDVLYPGSLAKEAAALQENPGVEIAVSDTALIGEDDERIGTYRRFPGSGRMDGKKLARFALMANNFFGAPCNVMFRRETAERLGGFDTSYGFIPDFEFWVRLAQAGDGYVIHEILNGFRVRADSNTDQVMGAGTRGNEYVAEHRRLVEAHGPALGLPPLAIEASVLWRRGRSRIIHWYLKFKQLRLRSR